MVSRLLSLLVLAILPVAYGGEAALEGPFPIYKTEPSFLPNAIKANFSSRDELAPGYIFIAPHIARTGYGPQIFDMDGELIWYGTPTVTHIEGSSVYAMDFRVCDYLGGEKTHLCYSEAHPKGAEDHGIREGGVNRVFDSAYEPVTKDYGQVGKLTHPNPHEFNMLPGGETFLQTVYQMRSMDLRPYGGDKDGWVYDGCFQEVNVRMRDVHFAWCTLKHVEVWKSYLFLNIKSNKQNFSTQTGGRGLHRDPWDFVHLNSVDKSSEGNYLISSRHISDIKQIAGPNNAQGVPPGTIMWHLGGKDSDFTFPEEALFTRQHHARYHSITKNETVISLFNNAWDGRTRATRPQSAAMIIRMNNDTMTATLDGLYESPKKKKSVAQGNTEVLPNGNVFVGWGTHPWWTEYHRNGTVLYHAEAYINTKAKLANYRAFKMPWVGKPKTKPKVVVYCQTCQAFSLYPGQKTSPLVAYVSWNGATEVKKWRFYLTSEYSQTAWIHVGTFDKTGFETKATLESQAFAAVAEFPRWVSVEALDEYGQILATTRAEPFVPNYKVKEHCNELQCSEPKRFSYVRKYNRNRTCSTDSNILVQLVVVAILLLALETSDRLFGELVAKKFSQPNQTSTHTIYKSLNVTESAPSQRNGFYSKSAPVNGQPDDSDVELEATPGTYRDA